VRKINVLPPEIFNLLAAGEVVENPASIVKEAVENSLDAGATEIEIAIEDGGFTEIRVTDNGAGCDESQIEKVFLPHATSKIASAKDLEKILTLGFRGEALSSIKSG
jgi:DNA mismatch repair protein MutL